MVGLMLTSLLWAMALGLVLSVVGVIGKRTTLSPTCAACRFDLSGVWPKICTCPECGAGLSRRRAVRTGRRRKRWICLALGVLLLLMPATAIVSVGLAMMSGTNLAKYKPAGLLAWEASNGNAKNSKAAGEEMLARLKADELSASQIDQCVRMALDEQGNPERPWCGEWGEFIELARLMGRVLDEDYARFKLQVCVLDVSLRRRLRPGRPLPVAVERREARVGMRSGYTAMLSVKSATIDGKSTSLAPRTVDTNNINYSDFGDMGVRLPKDLVAWFGLTEQSAVGPSDEGRQSVFFVTTPSDLTPGFHRLKLELTMKIDDVASGQGWFYGLRGTGKQSADAAASDLIITREMMFEVMPDGLPAIVPVRDESEVRARLESALTPRVQSFGGGYGMGGENYVMFTFQTEQLPVGVGFDVFWVVDGKEQKVGSFTSGLDAQSQALFPDIGFMYGSGLAGARGKTVGYSPGNRKLPEKGNLILRPNINELEATVDLYRVFVGEIVYKDIELH